MGGTRSASLYLRSFQVQYPNVIAGSGWNFKTAQDETQATFRYSLQILQIAFCFCLTFGEQ